MSAERDISVRQQNILHALNQIQPKAAGLSYEELKDASDLKSVSTVSFHLKKLTDRGLITPTNTKQRLTYITDKGKEYIEPKPLQASEE